MWILLAIWISVGLAIYALQRWLNSPTDGSIDNMRSYYIWIAALWPILTIVVLFVSAACLFAVAIAVWLIMPIYLICWCICSFIKHAIECIQSYISER